MKQYSQSLIAWWFTIMVPAHTSSTTLMARESLRKRRLLSIMLLASAFLTLVYIAYMGITATFTPQLFVCLGGEISLLFMLWLNRQGYLKIASLAFFFLSAGTLFLGAQITSQIDSHILLWTCFLLTIFLTVIGLFVSPWITFLLAVLENMVLFWYVQVVFHQQILLLLSPLELQHFLIYLVMFIYGNAFLGAYYAIATKAAVIQADRSDEVEKANNALTGAYAVIQRQALTDPLTDLPNHGAILAQIEKGLLNCQTTQRNCAIIFADIDHFKSINDTWGHGAGDAALCTVGQRLREGVREGDAVGRYGGEEFAILLMDIEQIEAVELAERLCCLLADHPCFWKQEETQTIVTIPLTASFGVATYPLDGITSKELIEKADAAMYTAKQTGRNRVCLPDEESVEMGSSQQSTSEDRTVQVLSTVAALHDQQTYSHALRMQDMAEAVARRLGCAEEEVQLIRLAAQLHDIGKMGIPDAILHKPGPLTQEEWVVMQSHPRMGQQILTHAGGRLDLISHIVVAHHERWDGHGYPYGLAQQEIPLGARILSVVDSYDAMTTTRPYREACSVELAQAELQRCAGTQFDPHVVDAFLHVLGVSKLGTRPDVESQQLIVR